MSPCMRCNGLVIVQYIPFTRFDDVKYFPRFMLRCLNCGDYFDQLVIANREIFQELLDERHENQCATEKKRPQNRIIIHVIREVERPKKPKPNPNDIKSVFKRHRDISRYT